ncbi:MAG: glutamate synthase [Clostridia bacterium]|nr:glutamate synthase [Clostridia bacterium]
MAYTINAGTTYYKEINEAVRKSGEQEIVIDNCIGQRYIGCSQSGCKITVNGTPGNALGAYLNGATLVIHGNAQDATGDTMNDGAIIIDGSSGDATGYAMRGGAIYVRGDVGYRAGIHMKAYKEKLPVLVVGGKAGSFLGEYQAGGKIVVLGLGCEDEVPVGDFCGTGMHGGKMYLRAKKAPRDLPPQVVVTEATHEDMAEIMPYIDSYCRYFGVEHTEILPHKFYVLTPDTKNPYKQLYVNN